jgi:hypothetical protein
MLILRKSGGAIANVSYGTFDAQARLIKFPSPDGEYHRIAFSAPATPNRCATSRCASPDTC